MPTLIILPVVNTKRSLRLSIRNQIRPHDDAVDQLDEEFLKSEGKTYEYFYDVITILSQGVRDVEDMELKAKYTELCFKMDNSANMISDRTLEEHLISSQEKRREKIKRDRNSAQDEKAKLEV